VNISLPKPALLKDVDYGQDETPTNGDEINDKVRSTSAFFELH
jgi:hypothetical protein